MTRRMKRWMSGGPASADAAASLPEEAAFDTLMGWLAWCIPTWGTSITLHVAVALLAFFVAGQAPPPPPAYVHTVRVAPIPPREIEKRRVGKVEGADKTEGTSLRSRGKMIPRPSTFVLEPTDNPIAGVGNLKTDRLVGIIGMADDRQMGGVEGLTSGGPRLFPQVWGIPGQASETGKVVYVVDRSGSMTDSLEIVKAELRRSVSDLEEGSQFHIIFYSSGPAIEMPTRRLVHATEHNKQLAFEFIDPIVAAGGTDPSQAIERAFAVKPDLIYLLTDGEFDRSIIDLVKQRNVGGKVKVYTIGFLYSPENRVLREIAEQNGGKYKFISEADLAEILGG